MHIPDNYLSPQTCAVMTAVMIPAWTISIKKIKAELPAGKLPLLGVAAAFSFLGMMFNIPLPGGTTAPQQQAPAVSEEGWYSSPEEVALYLHLYGCLPGNYLTKQEAKALGWNSSEGNLWEVAEGMSIGGDRFGNREGLLPEKEDRIWYECDVNYAGGYRGAERLLYSSGGLIYYTDDHYQSYPCLYGETGG